MKDLLHNYVLNELEPARVFHYFEEICSIPHGSYDVKRISDYLVQFAKEHNLEYIQDDLYNVILFADATDGYENAEGIILQGHMDMVAVHDADYAIDMTQQGLSLFIDDGYVGADHTSLGGDDGIALAYALAVLEATDLPHPRLEVVFTVNEEVGMDGAAGIDVSMLSGKRFINLDNEEEGQLLVSCAGGATYTSKMFYEMKQMQGTIFDVTISGLAGGHSGAEIDKGRANANLLLAGLLLKVIEEFPIYLVSINGGEKENAIPNQATARFLLRDKILVKADTVENTTQVKTYLASDLQCFVNELEARYRKELVAEDEGLCLSLVKCGESQTITCIRIEDTRKILRYICYLPAGIQQMSQTMPGLVETSLNLGILRTNEDHVMLQYCVRSAIDSRKTQLLELMDYIGDAYGATYETTNIYPGWQYRSGSKLEQDAVAIYKQLFGNDMRIEAIHAGVECGFFLEKLPQIEAISIGPDMKDIHTTRERLSIASVARTWKYLLALLASK